MLYFFFFHSLAGWMDGWQFMFIFCVLACFKYNIQTIVASLAQSALYAWRFHYFVRISLNNEWFCYCFGLGETVAISFVMYSVVENWSTHISYTSDQLSVKCFSYRGHLTLHDKTIEIYPKNRDITLTSSSYLPSNCCFFVPYQPSIYFPSEFFRI